MDPRTLALTIYGDDTCDDTERCMAHLDDLGIAYNYVNIDHDQETKQQVTDWNHGQLKTPVIVFGGGISPRIIEPTNEQLDGWLEERGLLVTHPER